MTSLTSLTSLIERIEAATEGSRELDILVGAAIDLHVDGGHLSFRNSFEICGMEQMLRMAESHQNIWREALPRYSTSIDAVMSLRPDGLVIRSTLIAEGLLQIHEAWFCRPDNDPLDGEIVIDGYTEPKPPALALLAAILRARQTEGQ